MTTVFLSGSRRISRVGEDVRQRLTNMVENGLDIITGDASGADKAMQACLAELHYPKVTVYFVGDAPRNNVGGWAAKRVIGNDGNLTGREFYAQKDKEMSKVADCGLVLWDGKSSGSVQNMIWLLSERKKVVVYLAPERRFCSLKTQDELVELLRQCDERTLDDLERKIALPDTLRKPNRRQSSLSFAPPLMRDT